ncbi:hypothetical protein EH165_15100 [Nakamurella antarctica]|uniref:SdpI/YhfL protein family protein n=1 Tax=Nakamurella antarctica TaxID=1902245 RepID=A0A3G8ZQ43_9ACTN|nr:SdpI family protein [Nakamurella antarctica]AZI59268.1 hypothetical protein EH165_15100 [Nakamurella antarctica]
MSEAPLALTAPLAAVMAVIAVVALVTGLKGKQGTLDADGRLGIRSAASLRSTKAFELANRVAAPIVLAAAGLAGLIALAMLIATNRLGTVSIVIVAVIGFVGVVALLVAAGSLGDRAAATVPKPASKPGSGGGCETCACGDGGCSGLAKAGITRSAPPTSS